MPSGKTQRGDTAHANRKKTPSAAKLTNNPAPRAPYYRSEAVNKGMKAGSQNALMRGPTVPIRPGEYSRH